MPWSTVLQAAIIAALTSLLRLVLATLPADPTSQPSAVVTINEPQSNDALRRAVREQQERIFP